MKKRLRDILKKEWEVRKILEKAHITARTPLLPCEDMDRVSRALTNVVKGEVRLEEVDGERYLAVYSKGVGPVEKIFNHFRQRQVLAALRSFLKKYSSDKEIVFYLHKQAAYVGVLSLAEPGESPGGEIVVSIHVDDAKEVIMWMTKF